MNKAIFISLVYLFISSVEDVLGTPPPPAPTRPTLRPTASPTTRTPTNVPTKRPTNFPSKTPTQTPTSPTSNPTSIVAAVRRVLTIDAICPSTQCNLNTIIMSNYSSICRASLTPLPVESCGADNNKNVLYRVHVNNLVIDTYSKSYLYSTSATNLFTFMNMLMNIRLRPVVSNYLGNSALSFIYNRIEINYFGLNTRITRPPIPYLFTEVNLYLNTIQA